MSRFTIVLDPQDYNERLAQPTWQRAARAAWFLIVFAALILLSFGFLADDTDTRACQQRLIAPGSYSFDSDRGGERIDRLDWDSEGYERRATDESRRIAPPCPS
jgi:hypothetical protein